MGKGNPSISTRVDPAANAALRGMALLRGITVSELVRQILSEWAREEIKDPYRKVAFILAEFDDLVKQLELDIAKLAVTKIPLQEQKGVGLETQKEREELYGIVRAMLRKAIELTESEEEAKNARARMDAIRLVNVTSRTGDAVLRNYDRTAYDALQGV